MDRREGYNFWLALNASRGFMLASGGSGEPSQDLEQGSVVKKSVFGEY